MLNKLVLAVIATSALAAAAFAPTAASAKPFPHWGWGHFGHGIGIGLYAPSAYDSPDCYIVREVVDTPMGPRLRRMTVCQ